jgi:hypothetical protein
MLYLTEISVPVQTAIDATLIVDPLVASDLDYCVKTWMADKPSLACRPWRAAIVRDAVRITGWRNEPATYREKTVYLGTHEVSLAAGQDLALTGRFVSLRGARRIVLGTLRPDGRTQKALMMPGCENG